MWERRELCLPALVVSQSLKPPEGVEVPCQGLVWVSSRSTGAQPLPPLPTSWVWPKSVNDIRAVCWHPEMWLLLFQRNPGFHLWLEPSRSVQPGRGGRENTARGSCVCIVFRQFIPQHGLCSCTAAKPDFMGLWVEKEKGKMSVSVVDSTCKAAVPCLEDVGSVFALPSLSGGKGGYK